MINQLQFAIFMSFIIFVMAVIMHVVKRNNTIISAYFYQSLALVALLVMQSIQEKSVELFVTTMVVLLIKVVIAPRVFLFLVHKSKRNVSSGTYLNVPMTLGVLVLLASFTTSEIFSPLTAILPHQQGLSLFLFGGMFISFFLTINRKGALSQLIGILSMENCIFAMSRFLKIHQLPFLEIGLLFDVLFWVIIACTFVYMIYSHYGSWEMSHLQKLKK